MRMWEQISRCTGATTCDFASAHRALQAQPIFGDLTAPATIVPIAPAAIITL